MAAVAHSPEFAKKAGVPQSVGKEFAKADKGRTFAKGGDMKSKKMAMGGMASQAPVGDKVGAAMDPRKAAMIAMAMMAKKKAGAKAEMPMKKGGAAKKMMGGGMAYAKGGGIETKGKTKGKIITMKSGGKMC
jgi:hypothetical protein